MCFRNTFSVTITIRIHAGLSYQTELRERATRIDQLKKKYEVLVMTIAPSGGDDGDGEQHSQAYYLVKAAQEREELQHQGDELDIKVCTTHIYTLSSKEACTHPSLTSFLPPLLVPRSDHLSLYAM